MSKTDKPKTAYGNARALIKNMLAETEGNPKLAKSHQRMLAAYEALAPIKDQINEKNQKLIEARESVKDLQEQIAKREEEIAFFRTEADKEPIFNTIQLRRMASAFTGVTEINDSTPVDTFHIRGDYEAVMSRVMTIIDPDSGVVGFKVFVNDHAFNVVMIDSLISACELRAGRSFNVDGNAEDALQVYQDAMTITFAIADSVAQLYGAFKHAIPFDNQHSEEASKILPGHMSGSKAVVLSDDGEADDSEEDEVDIDVDGDIDGDDDDISPEEMQNRVNAEEDDSPDDVDGE